MLSEKLSLVLSIRMFFGNVVEFQLVKLIWNALVLRNNNFQTIIILRIKSENHLGLSAYFLSTILK